MAQAKRGFTLTELLVVIAIIAVLASLATVGVMAAMSSARATRIKIELDQIDAALKRYKDTYGSYPPCNLAFDEGGISNAEKQRRLGQLRQHFAMAFQRYNADEPRLRRDLTEAGIDLTSFRPDQALVFWLRGFSSDPMAPVLSVDSRPIDPATGFVDRSPTGPKPQPRSNNFFEFDSTRLAGISTGGVANPAPSYFPANARMQVDATGATTFPTWQSGGVPIVYFDARNYAFADPVVGGNEAQPITFNGGASPVFSGAGVAAPYWHDRNANFRTNLTADFDTQETWANPDSYQLIAAGADNKYGAISPTLPIDARLYPVATRYDVADEDNATNISSKARIVDDRP